MSRRTNLPRCVPSGMDIRMILTHIQAGSSNRQIERDLNVDRRTVKRYRDWAEDQCLFESELPEIDHLQALLEKTLTDRQPPQNISSVEPYRKIVEKMVAQNVEAKAIYHRLEERGFEGSYSAVYRFVKKIKDQTSNATVRVERPPGWTIIFGISGFFHRNMHFRPKDRDLAAVPPECVQFF